MNLTNVSEAMNVVIFEVDVMNMKRAMDIQMSGILILRMIQIIRILKPCNSTAYCLGTMSVFHNP